MLRDIHKLPDNITIRSPNTPVTELINFAKRRELADICRAALCFQARVPSSETVPENLEIQGWIEEQFELVGALPEQWFAQKAADVQRREEDHSDIRYESLPD